MRSFQNLEILVFPGSEQNIRFSMPSAFVETFGRVLRMAASSTDVMFSPVRE
jgi:hypothetical protein